MSLAGPKANLAEAGRELLGRWYETKHSWRDGKAQEMDQQYLADLGDLVTAATHVIDEMDKILNKIHADCE